jgi:glycerol-3-phosphate dehydrogenase (NAD(P)+)
MGNMPESTTKVAILGLGAWGTTLGKVLVDNGNDVVMWGKNAQKVAEINSQHTNTVKLPDVVLPQGLQATTDVQLALSSSVMISSEMSISRLKPDVTDAQVVVVAIASQYVRQVLEDLLPQFVAVYSQDRRNWPVFVSTTKGLELSTGMMMSQVIADVLELPAEKVGCLAGPNLAREVAAGMPVAATLACKDLATSQFVAQLFASPNFATETTAEIYGVELLSCLKNVYALTTGYYAGKGYGDSTVATIITQAISECRQLLRACECDESVLLTYAGVGDLIATCTSNLSRNYSFGKMLGAGKSFSEACSKSCEVVEGVPTAHAFKAIVDKLGLNLPILAETIALVGATPEVPN